MNKKLKSAITWFRRQYDKLKKSSSLHITSGNWYVRYPDDLTRSIDMTYDRAVNLAKVHNGEVKWIDRRKEAREVAEARERINARREAVDPEHLLTALERIQNGDIPRKNAGICYNVVEHLETMHENNETKFISPVAAISVMSYLFTGWEYHQGAHVYPVPHDDAIGYWEEHNGALRQDLVDHMIRRLDMVLDHD